MIVGATAPFDSASALSICSLMSQALRPWCGGRSFVRESGIGAFGAISGISSGEPRDWVAWSADEQKVLVATGRIDNRDELQRELSAGPDASCGDLLLKAWSRWHESILHHLTGDCAFAVFHPGSGETWLGRTPLAARSLFFRQKGQAVAFASHPAALFAAPGVTKEMDWEHAALRAAQYSLLGNSTMFAGIQRVRPGEILRICDGAARSVAFWRPQRVTVTYRSIHEAGEAMRSVLDRAVADHLAGAEEHAGAHLSSGRDSSAVATSAALLLGGKGRQLRAYTGAPRAGFDDPSGPSWQGDESETAATTAALYANVVHRICRGQRGIALKQLRTLHRYHHQPITNFSNTHWWLALNDMAQADGVRVMLTGAVGNFTISAGPLDHLSDVVQEAGWSAALAAARMTGNPLGSARALIGAHLPASLDRAVLRMTGRWHREQVAVPILGEPYRRVAEQRLWQDFRDVRPQPSGFTMRQERLLSDDASDPFLSPIWGFEQRDPTADRRVIECCFSMPAKYLVPRADDPRPLYRAAFGERLPQDVVLGRRRGFQGADWFEQFPQEDVRSAFDRLLANPLNRELFDSEAINAMVEDWPSTDLGSWKVQHRYPSLLLNALSLADFIDHHWPA